EAELRRRELSERSLEQWKHRAARHAKPLTGCIFQRDREPPPATESSQGRYRLHQPGTLAVLTTRASKKAPTKLQAFSCLLAAAHRALAQATPAPAAVANDPGSHRPTAVPFCTRLFWANVFVVIIKSHR
ncbi:Protein of unknown function, partial [Gryllus bimaculatus]